MKRILVIEDEPQMLLGLRDNLELEGYDVMTAADGEEGLSKAASFGPDLVILDVMLPKKNGFDVCRELRTRSQAMPIVMLTARSAETDKVLGLELGADDYVTKPFSPRELVARVRAVLRRRATSGQSEVLRAGDLTLDVPRMRLTRGDEPIELTATEFALLAAMARQPGRVFTRSQLLDAIHGVAFESYERAVDAHIKNIRRKVEIDAHAPRHLLTVYGVGYRLAD